MNLNWIQIILEYSFYISTGVLLIYYRFLFFKIDKIKSVPSQNFPPVSVVICAKNELENLKANLPLVLKQRYPNFEVVVVNDHSTDKSLEWLNTIEDKKLTILNFTKEKKSQGKKEALAFGINHSKHQHLLLTDADCHPSSQNWIIGMASQFSDQTEIVLGVSLYEKNHSWVSKFMRWDSILVAVQYLSYAIVGKPYMSVGRNVAYTKDTFLAANGFSNHEHISSGDDDLFIQEATTRENTSVMTHPDSQTSSPAEESWKDFLRQKSRHHTTAPKYKASSLAMLGIYQYMISVFYLSLITGLALGINPAALLTVFLLKKLVQASVFKRIFFKIGVSEPLLPFLFFEGLWVLVLNYINIKNVFRSNNKW